MKKTKTKILEISLLRDLFFCTIIKKISCLKKDLYSGPVCRKKKTAWSVRRLTGGAVIEESTDEERVR